MKIFCAPSNLLPGRLSDLSFDLSSYAVSNVLGTLATNFTMEVTNNARWSIFATNSFTVTNFNGLEAGMGTRAFYVDMVVWGCSNTAPTITFPTMGGASYGIRLWTNANNPIITSITNVVRYRYQWEFVGTNVTLLNCATF
jgi:hypothetical protein